MATKTRAIVSSQPSRSRSPTPRERLTKTSPYRQQLPSPPPPYSPQHAPQVPFITSFMHTTPMSCLQFCPILSQVPGVRYSRFTTKTEVLGKTLLVVASHLSFRPRVPNMPPPRQLLPPRDRPAQCSRWVVIRTTSMSCPKFFPLLSQVHQVCGTTSYKKTKTKGAAQSFATGCGTTSTATGCGTTSTATKQMCRLRFRCRWPTISPSSPIQMPKCHLQHYSPPPSPIGRRCAHPLGGALP